ncbi:MAG: Crp/Fnr family transcriptional regulator, partial [Gemmatimonadales bacterium]
MLSSLAEADRSELLSRTIRRRFARNETLFHAGDPGDSLHLVARGRVAVRVGTPLGDVATLTIVGPGDFFGELALLSGHDRRTASGVALEAVETRMLTRDAFAELCHSHPAAVNVITGVLTTRVERLTGQLLEALYLPADKRVLRRLLDVVHLYERDGAGALVSLTQEDLASLAGTTRPTVNRVLKQAEADGMVVV